MRRVNGRSFGPSNGPLRQDKLTLLVLLTPPLVTYVGQQNLLSMWRARLLRKPCGANSKIGKERTSRWRWSETSPLSSSGKSLSICSRCGVFSFVVWNSLRQTNTNRSVCAQAGGCGELAAGGGRCRVLGLKHGARRESARQVDNKWRAKI